MMLKGENSVESYNIGFHESRKKFAYGVFEVSKASRDSESEWKWVYELRKTVSYFMPTL